ncbi:hypothetical protein SLE2022_101890 [Rubroshorea leprosula]
MLPDTGNSSVSDVTLREVEVVSDDRNEGAAAKVETKQVKKESQERWWKLSTWSLAKERRLKTLDLCSESKVRENLKVESIGGCRVRSDGESKGLFFGRNSKNTNEGRVGSSGKRFVPA